MKDLHVIPIIQQPRLASQEDMTTTTATDEEEEDDGRGRGSRASTANKPACLNSPVFESLKNIKRFWVNESSDLTDFRDDDGGSSVSRFYEIQDPTTGLHLLAKKKLKDGFRRLPSCYQHKKRGKTVLSIAIETSKGEPVMELEGFYGFNGLSKLKVTHGDEAIGEIRQKYDCCTPCNPMYTVYDQEDRLLFHILISDNGLCCGLCQVKSFQLVSWDKEISFGEIKNETGQERRRPRLFREGESDGWLCSSKRVPPSQFSVVLMDKLDLETNVMILAAVFALRFHQHGFRLT